MKAATFVILSSLMASADVHHLQELYTQKQYHAVIKQATSDKEEYSNVELHLLWARSARALGEDVEAMLAYERVLILDPTHTGVQNELAAIYMKLKKYKLALALDSTLQNKDASLKEVGIVDQRNSASKFNSSFRLSGGIDSNVNVHHKSEALDVFYGTTEHTNKIASPFLQASADLSYLREFSNHIYMNAALSGYYKIITHESDYSLYLNTFRTGVGYYQENFNLYFPISYSTLNYLGEDYLRIATFEPQLNYKLNKNFMIELTTKLEEREFKTDSDRNDQSVAVGLNLNHQSQNNYLFIDTLFQNYTSDSQIYQDFTNKKSYSLTIGMGHDFGNRIKTVGSYKVMWSDYEDNLGTELNPSNKIRADVYHQWNFKLSKEIDNHRSIFIEDEFSANKSNFIPAIYVKNTLNIGFEFKY